MSRGEEQKPVTKAYRDNWDAIFGRQKTIGGKAEMLVALLETEKAPPVKTEPCPECYPCKPGKRLIDADGFACFERCSYCGGEGVIPIED